MSSEIQKWADQAMFSAEPMIDQKPTVKLIWMTPDPLGAIASCAKMYKGEVIRDLSEVTDEERVQYFEDGTKTVLGAPFEDVQFHFLIEGVTRAFTHQLVRQRTATYFQESMRFAVIEEQFSDRVGLPPSLEGTTGGHEYTGGMEYDYLPLAEKQRVIWDGAVAAVERAYKELVNTGMPAEDARGLLPTNILTRVHYRTNLRDLLGHAGLRLCTQAQFEWRYVFNAIVGAIKTAETVIPTRAYTGNGRYVSDSERIAVHMRERLAGLFKPVCYQTGKCGFQASFDRACTIRERVNAFAENGVPSSEWHEGRLLDDPDDLPREQKHPRRLLPIYPAEWALDPSAARS